MPGFACIDCEDGCLTQRHSTNEGADEVTYGGGQHPTTCLSGTCDNVHGTCCCQEDEDYDLDEALVQAEDLRLALRSGDAVRVSAVLNRDGSVARIVPERRSVQMVNCSGEAIVNFPLEGDLFGEVVALQQ